MTNFLSFTWFRYKKGLIKCLIDRIYKINNSQSGVQQDLQDMSIALQKNSYPKLLIDDVIKKYLEPTVTVNQQTDEQVSYFRLPYLGKISLQINEKVTALCEKLCKKTKIKIAFTSFKIGNYFSTKDPIPKCYKSRIVYKFVCEGCNAHYIGHTTKQLFFRINEHFGRDKKSHIFKHLQETANCNEQCTDNCFSILDSATTINQLKIKEALYIRWYKPNINKQKRHWFINLPL